MPNQLLNQVAPIGAPPTHQEKTMSDEHRQCLYNVGKAEIFVGEEAIKAALGSGWKDHPDKVKPASKKKAAKKKAS